MTAENDVRQMAQILDEYYLIESEEGAEKAYKKIKRRYSIIGAAGAKLIALIKKYPGESAIGTIVGLIIAIASVLSVSAIGMFITVMMALPAFNTFVVFPYCMRMNNADYRRLCEELEKEMEVQGFSESQKRSARKLASTTRKLINKRADMKKKSKSVKEDLDYGLLIDYKFM